MVAMVKVVWETSVLGGLPAVSARPPLSPSPAHPHPFSCFEESEFPENMEKSLSHQRQVCRRDVETGLMPFLKVRTHRRSPFKQEVAQAIVNIFKGYFIIQLFMFQLQQNLDVNSSESALWLLVAMEISCSL